jgi:preprotein translocase SecF subunit
MGIDFAGGVAVEARTHGPADMGLLRERLSDLGLGPVQVQQFGSPEDVLLRFEQPHGGPQAQSQAVEQVKETLGQVAPGTDIRRVEVVGASVGSELFQEGVLALGLAAVAMFGYIAFRFEWPFAVGAIATMFLDLTKTVGFFALTGLEFNLTSIAAILTIMGFSINDKVVVYDRVRENLRIYKAKPLREVIDLSINETLSRTIGTSLALLPRHRAARTLRRPSAVGVRGGAALWARARDEFFNLHRSANPAEPWRDALAQEQSSPCTSRRGEGLVDLRSGAAVPLPHTVPRMAALRTCQMPPAGRPSR